MTFQSLLFSNGEAYFEEKIRRFQSARKKYVDQTFRQSVMSDVKLLWCWGIFFHLSSFIQTQRFMGVVEREKNSGSSDWELKLTLQSFFCLSFFEFSQLRGNVIYFSWAGTFLFWFWCFIAFRNGFNVEKFRKVDTLEKNFNDFQRKLGLLNIWESKEFWFNVFFISRHMFWVEA